MRAVWITLTLITNSISLNHNLNQGQIVRDIVFGGLWLWGGGQMSDHVIVAVGRGGPG